MVRNAATPTKWKTQKQESVRSQDCGDTRKTWPCPPPAAMGPRIFCLTAHSPYTFGDEQGRDRRDRPCVERCKAQPVSFFRPETALGQFPCFSPLFPFLSPSLCVASQSMPGHFLGHCTSSWQSGVLLCFVVGFCGLFYFCFWVFILFYFILKAGDAQP